MRCTFTPPPLHRPPLHFYSALYKGGSNSPNQVEDGPGPVPGRKPLQPINDVSTKGIFAGYNFWTDTPGGAALAGAGTGFAIFYNKASNTLVSVANTPGFVWNITAGNLGAPTASYLPHWEYDKDFIDMNDPANQISGFLTFDAPLLILSIPSGLAVGRLGLSVSLAFLKNPVGTIKTGLSGAKLGWSGIQSQLVNLKNDFSKWIMRNCFPAGTKILTDSGERPIEYIKTGDIVWSFNLSDGNWYLRKVQQTFCTEFEGKSVIISANGEKVHSTERHPFWVIRGIDLKNRPIRDHLPLVPDSSIIDGRWVDSNDLMIGDEVLIKHGEVAKIEKIEIIQLNGNVYNFEVEDFHNYSVGNSGFLVHNNNGIAPNSGVPKVNPFELSPSHNITKSAREMEALKQSIRNKGFLNNADEPVAYVVVNGEKFIVDGHHRVRAAKELAKELGITEIPAVEVQLPYKGYRTIDDLFNWER